MRKIIAEQRILAHDQNKVFVERAAARKLSPADAEEKYGLDDGKGNALIEFDIEEPLLQSKYNVILRIDELYIEGDVELANRNTVASLNR